MDAILEKTNAHDLTRAVVYSAVAGEMADEALSWIAQYMHQQVLREGLALDERRFSAGYGDFKIKYQKVFWDLLNLKNIGILLTPEHLLIPKIS